MAVEKVKPLREYPFHWTAGVEANAYIEKLHAKIAELERDRKDSLASLEKDIYCDLYDFWIAKRSADMTAAERAKIYTDRIMTYVKAHVARCLPNNDQA